MVCAKFGAPVGGCNPGWSRGVGGWLECDTVLVSDVLLDDIRLNGLQQTVPFNF